MEWYMIDEGQCIPSGRTGFFHSRATWYGNEGGDIEDTEVTVQMRRVALGASGQDSYLRVANPLTVLVTVMMTVGMK